MGGSERQDAKRISLPAGMELVVPPSAPEEAEQGRSGGGAAGALSRLATWLHAGDRRRLDTAPRR
jgi:hypothetical protein